MTEKIDEIEIRDRNVVTIPIKIRRLLNVAPGDYLRFERKNGLIIICKAVTRSVPNNCKHNNEVVGNTDGDKT